MAKFVAQRANFGYLGTYWRKGEVVEADECPNPHFVPLGQYHEDVAKADAAQKENEAKVAETVKKAVAARKVKK